MIIILQLNLTGKTVIPFCTDGGGGFCQIEKDIARECSKAILLPGLAANGAVEAEEVRKWLEEIETQL